MAGLSEFLIFSAGVVALGPTAVEALMFSSPNGASDSMRLARFYHDEDGGSMPGVNASGSRVYGRPEK